MNITHVFAGVAVTDYDSALGWYERLLGRPADRIPIPHAIVRLEKWSFEQSEGGRRPSCRSSAAPCSGSLVPVVALLALLALLLGRRRRSR